jgi:hypothetical protein
VMAPAPQLEAVRRHGLVIVNYLTSVGGTVKMQIPKEDLVQHRQIEPEPTRWFRLLPRWSLMVAVFTVALSVLILVFIGQQPQDSALGPEYVELLQAVRSPIAFRLGWTVDAIIWLFLGGSLLIMGGSLRRKAPIMAVIIGVSGIAQLIGFLGTLMRLQGTMDLAITYSSATPDLQGAVLNSYLDLWRIIRSHFSVPLLFSGLGFLLAAYCFFTVRGFPRWLAIWMAIPGILGLSQFIIMLAGLPKLHVLNLIGVGLGNIGLNLAITIALWRPSNSIYSALKRSG